MAHATIHPRDVFETIRKHKALILVPIVVFTAATTLYAFLHQSTWEASQAMIVRSEAGDKHGRMGKITQLEDMKNTQETLLELAKSRAVLVKALTSVGPAASEKATHWPTEQAIEDVLTRVSVEPPKGAEFGKTEMFYLKIKDADRERAVKLATAICIQLQNQLSSLRETTSIDTIKELERSVELARTSLANATQALGTVEKRVGNDLAELRILSDSPSGDSDLRRNLVELEKELRAYKAAQVENEESLNLLLDAQEDPQKLLASPALLIKSQPALGRLKDGLVDAQLRSGQALGTMSEDHPMVIGAREAERVIREQLHQEISLAIKGVESDLQIGADRIQSVQNQLRTSRERLSRLVELRVEYANLNDAVRNRSETLKTVENELADAHAAHAAIQATSRVSLINGPDTGTRPIGPGRKVIAASGFGGGLLIAAALVFLLTNPTPTAPTDRAEEASENVDRLLVNPDDIHHIPARLTLSQALQRVAG